MMVKHKVKKLWYFGRWIVCSTIFFASTMYSQSATQNPIVFVGQVPQNNDFATIGSTFANHFSTVTSAPRGGGLYILYPDGERKNLTELAGYGMSGEFQGKNSIAVRDPCVYWSGNKILFSMVVGAPEEQYKRGTYYWQLYEATGLEKNASPTITKVENQPEKYNNITPIYGTDDKIIFTSDRPFRGLEHLYPLLDEYETTPTNSGIWRLDPATGNIDMLDHAPSGDFTPIIDSFGRLLFTKWDHLQRDQQADSDATGGTYRGMFTYSDESADASRQLVVEAIANGDLSNAEVFPEPRSDRPELLAGTNMIGHRFNHFFPWMMNEDGSAQETLNHIGRHELHHFFTRSRSDDPELQEFSGNRVALNIFQMQEDPRIPGHYFAIDAPEFQTHASGELLTILAPPSTSANDIEVKKLSAPSSGYYRNPLPMANGEVVAVHAGNTDFNFRLRKLVLENGVWSLGEFLTAGISRSISYWNPDQMATYSGPLWELSPVEVRARTRPEPANMEQLPDIEKSIFDEENVKVSDFTKYLEENNLALVIGRNLTTRDDADKQQPFNLRVAGTETETVAPNSNGRVYDISHLQFFQADHLRGIGGVENGNGGRRVIAREMHESAAMDNNIPSTGPSGSVKIGDDGSMAAFLPAGRAMTWQMTSPDGGAVVRERVWLTFRRGEVRVCTSCHGVNDKDQAGNPPPTNSPKAVRDLLQHWKQLVDYDTTTAEEDTESPSISELTVADITTQSISVQWKTNELATSEIEYGTDENFGLSESFEGFETNHTMVISNLNPDATYFFRIKTVDTSGNASYSSSNSVTTKGISTEEPSTRGAYVARNQSFMGFSEEFNRYYTDSSWQPKRTLYVSRTGQNTEVVSNSRSAPFSPSGVIEHVQPGDIVIFLRDEVPYESVNIRLSEDTSGTFDEPIVFYGERNEDGGIGVTMECANGGTNASSSCFNLEASNYIAIDGFEMSGGFYGLRSVGAGYSPAENQKGVMVVHCDVHDQFKDPIFTGQSSWVVLESNVAHGAGEGDGHGIYLSNGGDWNIIRFNELFDNSGVGFQINADPSFTCLDVGIAYTDSRCDGAIEDGNGQGISEYMLLEGNYFHDDNAGVNFTSARKSLVRGNIFGPYTRHNTSFWQETDNPNLGSHSNVLERNLFIGNNNRHLIQFINSSNNNSLRENIFLGLSESGTGANPSTVLVEMDLSTHSSQGIIEGNYFIGGQFEGYVPNNDGIHSANFSSDWFEDAPFGDLGEPEDCTPTSSAPFIGFGGWKPMVQGQTLTASLSLSKVSGDAPLTVTLDGSLSGPVDEISRFEWNFGNGEVTTTESNTVNYTYNQPGNYTAVLTLFNEDGASATSTAILISVGPENQVPVSEGGAFLTDASVPIEIPLSYSDQDGGPGPYTITIQSQPTGGILTGEGTSWIYSPGMGFVGTDSFMWSVNDGAEESLTSLITISIVDDEDPIFLECPPDISIVSQEASCMTPVTWNEPIAEDNVSIIKLSSNYASGDPFSVGQTVISYTAEDSSANTAVCEFSIHVIPEKLPVVSGCPSDISVINSPGRGGAFVDWDLPTVFHD